MAGQLRTAIPFREGKLVLEGTGWDGQPMRVEVGSVFFESSDGLVEVMDEEDDIFGTDDRALKISTRREFSIHLEARMFESGEEGLLYNVTRPAPETESKPEAWGPRQ